MQVLSIVHTVSQTVIAMAIIGCVTVLGLQGTLDASAVTGILGAVGGIAGGVTGVKIGSEIANGRNVK